jgi:hypothetical protein
MPVGSRWCAGNRRSGPSGPPSSSGCTRSTRPTGRELARICAYLPIDVSADVLADVVARHAYTAVPRADKGDDKEIRSATPGGWRENLTPAEHDVMHEVMGTKLAELGYLEPTPVGLA